MSAGLSLHGKIALITGATSGIGRATAELFSKLGGILALTGRNEQSLQNMTENCEKNNKAQVWSMCCELTNEQEVEKLVASVIEKYKRLDILVNNAGILELGSIENTSLAQYDRLMNTNVRSIYHLTMLCVPHLIKTKGCIVNVSSVNGIRSFPNVLAYCMSKAAVDSFTMCTALELASKGVRVNAVNPGVIKTDLQKRGGLNDDAYKKFLEHSKETHALGRPGEAGEVAEAIAFLASGASSFITGSLLPVDGGRHAMCPR